MTASNLQRFERYLAAYAAKDIRAIDAMLAPDVRLRDWNINVRGKAATLAETQSNFDNATSIAVEILCTTESTSSVSGELRILVDGDIELFVVDVIDFDEQGQVTAVRSYKGRGD
jgi:steroid delta-isomerase